MIQTNQLSGNQMLENVLDSVYGIDAVAEYLRNEFFDQSKGFGCYSSFDLRYGVFDITSKCNTVLEVQEHHAKRWITIAGMPHLVEMAYYWEGDGYLRFMISRPGKRPSIILENRDCKKNHGWKMSERYL